MSTFILQLVKIMTKNLGDIVKRERKAKMLTQSELGLMAFNGMNSASAQAKIKRIESGDQTLKADEISSLAGALEIDIQTLLNLGDKKQTMNHLDGIRISQKVLDRFPKLRPVLRMLNDAVEIEDANLINAVVASISDLVSDANNEDKQRVSEQLRA